MTRVTARARLHFGLLNPRTGTTPDWGEVPVRQFGGVGLMIDEPSISVRVEPANEWTAEGPLAERALTFAQRAADVSQRCMFHVIVESCPPEHTGLGVGTALGLAVAKAIALETGTDAPSPELAKRIGRGERSAIGVHGFDQGGLLVDGGKRPGESLSPLVAHAPFPDEWKVELHQPEGDSRWFGPRERQAFADLPGPTGAELDRLCRLVLLGILPGIRNRDLQTFGEAVYEYNARVGDLFAAVQGGRYTSPAIAAKVKKLRANGIRCVGQSSWGPTVFEIKER